MTETPVLYDVTIRYHVGIPVRDGLRLSATLFVPQPRVAGETFPAILEMIPYRKDDWRYSTDHSRMSYLAQRGYIGCRLDIRGTGSSPGIASDEYSVDETNDGYDAVEWLAAQPWCNGNVGMWGISYGGFTSIQVALLQPPHLKAIVPMYATDDRYLDDVHYIGGCLTASELAQYAVSQVGMNALPGRMEYLGADWAEHWKQRLEQTPPWLIEWLRQQTDGSYWRQGSLAPEYERIRCAIFLIGGWADSYTNPVLRMLEHCAAPRKALIGPWVHSTPDVAYPGPNVDFLHEMVRFFDYWLKGSDNGAMDEPMLTFHRKEYTIPEAFPKEVNGAWAAQTVYPAAAPETQTLWLGHGVLELRMQNEELRSVADSEELHNSQFSILNSVDVFRHYPTLGIRAGLCFGAGSAPNGLARDLRPDEALSMVYTGAPLAAPLDVLGFPELIVHLSCNAPVATFVARLTDVASDGTSALVSTGILNLTHRDSHSAPQPLVPGEVYQVRLALKATGYRFLPGHRLRLSLTGGYWPALWPSPYLSEVSVHRGAATPSRLVLPLAATSDAVAPPALKTTAPELATFGDGRYEPAVWENVEDVVRGTSTIKIYGGDTTLLPEDRSLFNSERIELTTYERDPAHTVMYNEVVYRLVEQGYTIEVRATGSIRSDKHIFHIDVQLAVQLNGAEFFRKSWLESVPRRMV